MKNKKILFSVTMCFFAVTIVLLMFAADNSVAETKFTVKP